jgi:hypothetical protein
LTYSRLAFAFPDDGVVVVIFPVMMLVSTMTNDNASLASYSIIIPDSITIIDPSCRACIGQP